MMQKVSRIGFVLLPGFAMMSCSSALEPLRAANILAGEELYGWRLLSLDGAPVVASNRLRVEVDGALDDVEGLDTIIVCAGGNPAEFDDARLWRWLRAVARRGLTLGGVSAGPYLLARAGVLDGYRATVHWEHAAAFAEEFTRVELRSSLFEADRNRLTCAGGVAALDMMHHVIGEAHGFALARAVGDWFLQAHVRPGEGEQRLGLPERLGVRNARLERIIDMMESRIESPATREELAQAAQISLRQIDRLFAEHLGMGAEAYYQNIRLTRARELLRQTNLPITEVAMATGFSSASHFSRAYRRKYARAPREERV
ncbi:GlxA family transcriptional regulator [Xanthobacter sp. TB0136]|uniref:GlxA family transcriptional regulator n=1 Tax=Xanthobacter sp. TB0136 TaxID=3459177 RepID=UPI00403A0414